MKKFIIVVIFVMLCPILVTAQAKQIHLILEKYEKRKNVESIIISPSVLQMVSNNNYNSPTKDLLAKIREMRIVNVKKGAEESGTPLKIIIRGELDKVLTGDRFSRVLKMQEGEEFLELFVTKETEGVLVFLATTPNEFSVISIFGNIDKNVINAVMTGGIRVK